MLPSIRKIDVHAAPQTIEEMLKNPEAFLELVQNYIKQERELNTTRQLLAEAKPKVIYYDIVLKSKLFMTVTQIVKDFGLSAKRLNKLLAEVGVQFKQSSQWQLFQTYAAKGYTRSETYFDDFGGTHLLTKWTQMGTSLFTTYLKTALAFCLYVSVKRQLTHKPPVVRFTELVDASPNHERFNATVPGRCVYV